VNKKETEYLADTEKMLQEVLTDTRQSDKYLSNVAAIRKQLILPLCGHRKTLEEAFDYIMKLSNGAGEEGMTIITAVGVTINTIRYVLEKAVDAEGTFGEKKDD
tara:strand:- start:17 stop:328 length:312 start_codon:yes stop_codon:yes gene_type:complete